MIKPVADPSFDRWLLRLSYISQFGLFALTLGALYFTVIPLYKTAVLEEGIAKKEIELKDAERQLAAAKLTLREVTEKTYVRDRSELVRDLVLSAVPRCSGLLRPAVEPPKLGDSSAERQLLEIDVSECLKSELEARRPQEKLRKEDLEHLTNTVSTLRASLGKRRQEALKKIAAIPELAVRDRRILAPKGPWESSLEEFETQLRELDVRAKQILPQVRTRDWEQIELQRAIRRTQAAIATAFEKEVRDDVFKLRAMEWPVLTSPNKA